MTMVLIIVVASVMVLGFLIATGSNKNINSRTEHEADLLEKHFKEELTPPAIEVKRAKATVVLMSFVGAANSPFGNSKMRQGISAPVQFDTKINKKIVPKNGTHFKYSSSPI